MRAESEGEMKAGEMTAEVKLLRKYATAMYAYTNADVGSEEEKQAEAITDELESQLLARLNAGGSPDKASGESCEECTWLGCQGVCGCKCHKRGASQPLQPRCPLCGSKDLTLYVHDGDVFMHCSDTQEHGAIPLETGVDLAQFFSAPPALPRDRYVVKASPQLEQVAREICDLDKQRNKYAESNWQIERPKLIISILQRHFPSGEGTVQCAGTKEYLELRDKMSPPLTPRKEEG